MKALILNSGLGSRMGDITNTHPKCMTEIDDNDTIVSRQLKLLSSCGVTDIVMTTGYFNEVLIDYCNGLGLDLNIEYINNPRFRETNYIYSIYCAKDLLHDDIIMMHGDLVFTLDILKRIISSDNSVMTISSTLPLPEKDFKSVVIGDTIEKVGIEFFDSAYAAQPLYKIKKEDWEVWLDSIVSFCEKGITSCYAENAFNEVSDKCLIYPLDVKDELCSEIDNPEDLDRISNEVKKLRK